MAQLRSRTRFEWEDKTHPDMPAPMAVWIIDDAGKALDFGTSRSPEI